MWWMGTAGAGISACTRRPIPRGSRNDPVALGWAVRGPPNPRGDGEGLNKGDVPHGTLLQTPTRFFFFPKKPNLPKVEMPRVEPGWGELLRRGGWVTLIAADGRAGGES